MSFGLQLAATAEEVREFVLSSSEIITRFMDRYQRYESFRSRETGEEFDRLLTNVYKALLLYMIALDGYLRQSGPGLSSSLPINAGFDDTNSISLGRVARAINKLEDQPINASKRAIDAADAEVRDWVSSASILQTRTSLRCHQLLIIMLTRNDNNFSEIRGILQARNLPEVPEPSQECLKSLFFREMEDRFYNIERAAKGTNKWLLRHEKYRELTDDDRGMLCIKGKPGSGKSTLLQYAVGDAIVASTISDRSLLQHNKDLIGSSEGSGAQPDPNVVILSFFFHDRGTDLQKTPLGLFRSLLHQLLRQVPEAIPDTLLRTFQDRKKMGEAGERWDWKWREVRDFFEISLQKALESRQIWTFIDALDEYGEDDANELIESFNTWFQACPPQAQFRVCFTCRHYPPLNFPEGMVEIHLEQETKDDISTYVQTKLSSWSEDENLATIWKDIADRASGVFMWARLMVPRVLRLHRSGENWRRIKREIESTPQALDELYRDLVKKVEADPNSLKLIQWICFAMEPLTLNELRWAMIVDPNYSGEPVSLEHCQNTEDFATDCDMMEKKLKALSCGLAEARTPSRLVQFIHQSVKDFFIKEGLAMLHKGQNPDGTDTKEAALEGAAHYQLSRTCIRYFSAQEIMQSIIAELKSIFVFPLLRYAVCHWITHVQRSEMTTSQADLLDYFRWPSEDIVHVWTEAFLLMSRYHFAPDFPRPSTTLLHIASRHRLMGPLLGILQSKEILRGNRLDAGDDGDRTPLHFAVDECREDVVCLLLEKGANVNFQCGRFGPVLFTASRKGHKQIIRILLDCGADVNAQSEDYGNALQVASVRGHEQIVRILLDCGADVNAQCGHRGNALQAASAFGYEQIARILLEKGADVNAVGGFYDTALQAASFDGCRKVVDLLLENGADVNGGETSTALIRALDQNIPDEQIVRVLLQNGADVNARNRKYNNLTALEVASRKGHQEIVKMLLEYGAGRAEPVS